ncbi:MAG: cysteine--tRNA ligase [Candidatus Sericytochromatia bacterium]
MNKGLRLYNTLTRTKEVFKPINDNFIKMYTCGPTVYNYAHIGNLRSYIFPDILKKLLTFIGYEVKQIINFTDVGHLVSDADEGADKIEKAAAETGKSAWEISEFYAQVFKKDIEALNITFPSKFTYATKYIEEQINMVKTLEEKGLTYNTSDGVYYDTSKFQDYGKMAKLDVEGLDEGTRVDFKEKRNKTDFALWKLSPKDQQRQMEWESPWGKGFPGWHIECSAMIFAELGQHIDIHTGGTDHIPVHHTNEIAQSEGASGEKFVNYWLHGAFLVLDKNMKMSKSEGNFIGLKELLEENFSPIAYRYLNLTSHYRSFLTFSPDILKSAQTAYFNLKRHIKNISEKNDSKGLEKATVFDEKIIDALLDDMNVPKAIGFIWELVQDNEIGSKEKLEIISKYDQILSLNLNDFSDLPELNFEIPDNVKKLAEERWSVRLAKDFKESDRLRNEIHALGFEVKDSKQGYEIVPLG